MNKTPGTTRPEPAQAATRAEEKTTASEDQGAEAARATERDAAADDYEANARLDDDAPDDFADDPDIHDRPDTALIEKERGEG